MNRRHFSQSLVATTVFGFSALQTSTSGAQILGANSRVRLGFIGIANRGCQDIRAFMDNADQMEITALCDVNSTTLGKVRAEHGNKPFAATDFRKIYDRNDVDAVVLATPDHWHAIQTVEACKAGKDVYCEKPVSATVVEGRIMVEAARKYKRVVQIGIHRRSATHFQQVAQLGADNVLGFVTMARTFHGSNMTPDGIGNCQPTDPPADLDWDMWLGPRPARPYQENIAPYKFRWWDLYSSQVANQGVHFLDAVRWFLGELAPSSVCAMGGKFALKDDRTIPDTMEVIFQFDSGRLVTFTQGEACGNPFMATDENYRPYGWFELRGTNGTMYVSEQKAMVMPERGGQFAPRGNKMEKRLFPGSTLRETEKRHTGNFLECIRTRQLPNCDIEQGHRSTTMSLIANISLALKQRLEWDGTAEKFIGNTDANQLLHYEYRQPWKLEL